MDVSDGDIGKALTGMMRRFEAEYQSMTESELEQRWYFRWDPKSSLARNIYQLHGCLTLYGGSCRRWEEMHNGSSCVVERVRDNYLMPKIKEFARLLASLPAAEEK